MRKLLILFLLLIPTIASAGADKAAIEERATELLRVDTIDEIRPTGIKGLYEVRSGRNLFYSDAKGDYFVLGGAALVDTKARKNLTAERKEEINRIDWSLLPLDKAVVSGDPSSKLKLAVFTDPDCPYCRKLELELKELKGVAVYTFLFPLEQLHPHARAKAEAIWCAKDQHAMLKKVMLEKFVPEKATCATPIEAIKKLAGTLDISGTPTMIAGDGRIASGIKSAGELKTWLENN